MVEPILLATIFVSFFCTFLIIPFWIRKAKQIGLIWENMNKYNHPKNLAGSGGIIVVMGTIVGVFLYIAIQTFYFNDINSISTSIFAIISILFLTAGIGLIDDLFGWQHGGLSSRSRLILTAFAAVPLMIINAGQSEMLGIEFGIFYPLLIIPFGVMVATTTFNILAGFNGLEAGQGIIILSAMAYVTYVTGNGWLSIIALCMVASLLAFYVFNKYPGNLLPGDVMTYSVGALMAAIAILGNIEKLALIFFIPYGIESVLKLRGKLKKHSFGRPNRDGSLEVPYDKFYGLEHIAIWLIKKMKTSGKAYEWEVTYLINGFQIIVVLIGILFFL